MVDIKVSDLNNANSISATDLIYISQDQGGGSWQSKSVTAINAFSSGATFVVSAGRSTNSVNNSYLRGPDGVEHNLAGSVLPFDSKLIAMSAATTGPETWLLEVRKNDVATAEATLNVTSDTGYNNTFDVDFDAGDEIQLYCNGTGISRPHGNAVFIRRG